MAGKRKLTEKQEAALAVGRQVARARREAGKPYKRTEEAGGSGRVRAGSYREEGSKRGTGNAGRGQARRRGSRPEQRPGIRERAVDVAARVLGV